VLSLHHAAKEQDVVLNGILCMLVVTTSTNELHGTESFLRG